ncbi:MAG: cyclic pyranopterin monophosphate synthase MoaC [Chloroflexi bacterium]|nr:cyclic pyranopterin monophosphate synthase MoaC [Chloroflexota bacterium]
MTEAQLSHVDEQGRARMVDVSAKDDTVRVATARGAVTMLPETLALIQQNGIAKGDVLTVAQIAGIMAAKRTSDLIPMCHPLMLTNVAVTLTPNPEQNRVDIEATVRTMGKTGVEMEALAATLCWRTNIAAPHPGGRGAVGNAMRRVRPERRPRRAAPTAG